MKKGLILSAIAAAIFGLNTVALSQTEYAISAVQGKGNQSPFAGRDVRVQGIVTAVTRTGFFVQTPDDKVDSDPMTSEGVYVFTREAPPEEASIGALVVVTGKVEEFRPRTEQNTLPLTEIVVGQGGGSVKAVSRDNPLPKPVAITAEDMRGNAIDQLEKFEGMRVSVAALTAVSGTGGRVNIKTSSAETNGTFFGVLKGTPRPFREPGLGIFDYVFLETKEQEQLKKTYPKIPIFDGNPERIRVESTAQMGTVAINVAALQEITELTGVLHYSYRTPTLFVDRDSKHKVGGGFAPAGIPNLSPDQFSVASMNIENFFDDVDDAGIDEDVVEKDAFAKRLQKISMAIRDRLLMPDVIGIAEAENLNALKKLAEKINADAKAAGKPDPQYDGFLIEGNDGRGIDNGFLVKTARVKVLEVKQFGKVDKYKHPTTGEQIFLNDRPPLMLRASVPNPRGGTLEFTVFANHLKSFNGYSDERQKDNVRLKKRLQSEFLAKLVQDRQKADAKERIIVMGDLNMYQFSDGITDLVGTIIGKPASSDAVMNSSPDVVDPDLINLVDLIAQKERYSYVFDGNAQVLDHIIINQAFRPNVVGFGYIRVNADLPEILRNDGNRPERSSDHDPAIAFFKLN